MKKLITIMAAVAVILALNSDSVQATTLVNLSLEPSTKTVSVGQAFSMEVWMRLNPPGEGLDLCGMDMDLQWDKTYVRLDGVTVTASCSANFSESDFSDGDAILTVVFNDYPNTTYTDQHPATLHFTALAVTESTLLTIPSSLGHNIPTCVASYGEPWDVTGTLTGADITIVPEPSTIALLGLGGLALLILRSRRAS